MHYSYVFSSEYLRSSKNIKFQFHNRFFNTFSSGENINKPFRLQNVPNLTHLQDKIAYFVPPKRGTQKRKG